MPDFYMQVTAFLVALEKSGLKKIKQNRQEI